MLKKQTKSPMMLSPGSTLSCTYIVVMERPFDAAALTRPQAVCGTYFYIVVMMMVTMTTSSQ